MPTQPPTTPQADSLSSASTASTHRLTYQQQFHQRWSALGDRHVRALAWLLESPDLLAAHAPRWQGRIATVGKLSEMDITWLHALDKTPRLLYAAINAQLSNRLGKYAEKLLTFYLQHVGRLLAHNVQVRNGPNDTVGEFDFLVRDRVLHDVVHWELATKFYLLHAQQQNVQADAFVGPNLVDSLGAKMSKIMQQQLMLSSHPAAARYLPESVSRAQAMVKGWLFYDDPAAADALPPALGIAAGHCRGFWCELSALDLSQSAHYLILSRLEWLAPARAGLNQALSAAQLPEAIDRLFAENLTPVMIAVCDVDGEWVLERERGFVVPDGWRQQAAHRVQQAVVTY